MSSECLQISSVMNKSALLRVGDSATGGCCEFFERVGWHWFIGKNHVMVWSARVTLLRAALTAV